LLEANIKTRATTSKTQRLSNLRLSRRARASRHADDGSAALPGVHYAVSGNHPGLWWFCNQVRSLWLKTLRRRSQKADLPWERFIRLVDRFFPPIKTLHPLPVIASTPKPEGGDPMQVQRAG